MSTRPGNRLGVTDADLGIWPLLWVRQGKTPSATPDRASLVEASGRTAGALGALLTERDALARAWTEAGGEGIAREHSAEVTALAGIEDR